MAEDRAEEINIASERPSGELTRHPSFSSALPSATQIVTIIDYLQRHDESFDELPFNPVDSLVLSSLAYLDYDAYRYENATTSQALPLVDVIRFTDLDIMASSGWIRTSKDLPAFLEALLRCHRYADLCVGYFVNENAAVIEKQFCACTFTFDQGRKHYIAFRGTDGTFAGWKEDFNLSYRKVIPSQRSAEFYVSGVLSALPKEKHVYVGGHSKGGNLAEFAAATIDEAGYARIDGIFNHDGPNFLNAPSPRVREQHFRDKLNKTVPESSIFGMILEHRDEYAIVQSDAPGIFQHNPFTWLVDDADFLYQEQLNASAQMFDETLDAWLKSCTPEQRETFIDTIYELIVSSDATSWKEFQESGLLGNVATFLRDGRNLDAETKEILVHTLRNLGTVANAAVRKRLRRFAQRMRANARATFSE